MLKRLDDKLDKLIVQVATIQKDVSQNTRDLSEHIRRTNLLEDKLSATNARLRKMLTGCVFIAGAASTYYWPQVSTFLKFVI